jgi:glycosyltransferase involved in cell wall biosynthesis
MLEQRDMIVMSGDWGRSPNAIQHITEIFARKNRVIWVSGIPVRGPRLRIKDARRVVDKGLKVLKRGHVSARDPIPVEEIHPFFVPFYDIDAVRKFNDDRLVSAITSTMDRLQFRNPVLMLTNPMTAGCLGRLRERSSHYLCIDDYGANEHAFKMLPSLEASILNRVDSSWSMSDVLMKSRIPKSSENHFFPEGVNTTHFVRRGGTLPSEFAGLKRPIIGYCGLISHWMDIDVVIKCARAYPDATLLILGEAKIDISRLTAEPNVVCPGHIAYELLPRYMELFDVGLIPRVINRLTIAMNPLKLLEYLAMELPVVSSDLPEVRKFGDYVHLASDHDGFVAAVGKALDEDSIEKRRARREVAERYSWQSVVDEMSRVIQRVESKHGT